MDVLLQIIKEPVIRATCVSYLNDTSEREHFLRLARRRLTEDFLKSHPLIDSSVVATFVEEGGGGIDLGIMSRPFAASFSSEGDLLPQWRSYCPNGNGVSIGFRTDCLKSATVPAQETTGSKWLYQAPGVTFGKVAYMHEEQTYAIDKAIVEAATAAVTSAIESRESDGDAATSASDFFIATMEEKTCFTKDQSFSNEREYRLLVSPLYLHTRYNFLEFRASRTTLIPYVNVAIPPHAAQPLPRSLFDSLYSRSDRTDFIDSIVIGPAPNSGLSKDAVECLLAKHSMKTQVATSKVPYRDL